ncbi:MAG: hypothetical protein LCI00_15150 [Chloroflexi bacterium]|nr:hypothetical protein [Chloroflexota bacterium]MCC6892635.1 hypothetical protein [Anaerolineae bacterium]
MMNHKLNDQEIDQLMRALAHMRESELARLLDIVETLVHELKLVSRRGPESPAAVASARRLIQCWNTEVQRILKMQQRNDAA